jgi:hypothetical protein
VIFCGVGGRAKSGGIDFAPPPNKRCRSELLPVPYDHVVFTLPAALGAVAFQNKAAVYDLLFRTAAKH